MAKKTSQKRAIKKSSAKPASPRQSTGKKGPAKKGPARKPATKPRASQPTRARKAPAAQTGSAAVRNPPAGYPTLSPYLIVRGAAKALAFYAQALGARELYRLDMGGGKIGHAELVVGNSPFMLADEHPEMGFRSPLALGGTPVSLLVYVPDCDKAVQRMVSAGATLMRLVQDHFYGDRAGTVIDPFGHVWTLATHVEDVPPAEILRRAAELHGG